MLQISPSLLSADFARLAWEIERVPNADMLHLDVMDGHFVPNLAIGLPVLASVRKVTGQFLDVHLMISEPLRYAEAFAEAGADLICFHYESQNRPGDVLDAIHGLGKKAGIALRPSTPVCVLEPFLPRMDLALIMTVEPGFGGQNFQESALERISEVSRWADRQNPALWIEVDGGIVPATAARCIQAGANVLVAGSYVFGSGDPAGAIEALRSQADQLK